MRTTITVTILILGLATGIAHADPYRWCAEGSNGCGTTSCTSRRSSNAAPRPRATAANARSTRSTPGPTTLVRGS